MSLLTRLSPHSASVAGLRYAELRVRSNFSFLEGGSHPETLVAVARELGLQALALTDRDGFYGSVRFAKAARASGISGIIGAELTIDDDPHGDAPSSPVRTRDERPRLVLLASSFEGYRNLAHLISIAQMRHRKREARLRIDDLDGRTAGLIALSGGPQGYIEAALLADDAPAARERADRLRALFPGALFVELQHHLHESDAALLAASIALARDLALPVVATNGVFYARAADAKLADILTCIRHGVALADAGTRLRPNAEYALKSAAAMTRLFAPYPRAISRTLEIAERCTFRLDRLDGQFPDFHPPDGGTDTNAYLREQVYAGAARRYGARLDERVRKQLEHELALIKTQDLSGYFLIVWDIVRAAAKLDVLAQGRGSAANSAVCYALGITAVDPVGMGLLFERFMSADRKEIPDIDIDFAHERREAVIQYVYDTYGRDHAAMAAEVITYRTRSAIRDVGKAFGLSPAQVEAITAEYDARESLAGALGVEQDDAYDRARHLSPSVRKRRDLDSGSNLRPSRETTGTHYRFSNQDIGKNPDPLIESPVGGVLGETLLAFCRRIDGFPRHLGIHSGGMVITRDPLIHVAPVENATMPGRTVLQWDKDDLQDLGLIKIDLLGLGMLSLLQNAFELEARRYPERAPSSLATIPQDDAATYAMLQRADSIGVFQVESRAQQSMLPRLKPAVFYDLVMQVAIIRPGPIQGKMIHPFLRRRSGREDIVYPDERLRPILERTLGVPLFQEQGMRMAIECAGFTAGEADELRRAMGHKRSRERMLHIYPRLVNGMVAQGIKRDAADQLFRMLEGFANYGFPESHAASFALLAYASAYLKCHEPAIFAAAILNVQPMGFYSSEVLINDAKRHGVVVKRVTVNASELWSFVDDDGALQLGYHLVRGLGASGRAALEHALSNGPFIDLHDFVRRAPVGAEALEALAGAHVFAPWFRSRRDALWALRGAVEQQARGALAAAMETHETALTFAPLHAVEETRLDLWSTGVAAGTQPIAHLREQLTRRGACTAVALASMPHKSIRRVGGMVITRQRPGTAKGYVFLTLEDETGLVNVIVRPDMYERHRRLIRASAALIVEGILQREEGCVDLLARDFERLEVGNLIDGIHARNFH